MYIFLLYCFAMTLYHIFVLLVSSLIMFVFPVVCRCGYPYLYCFSFIHLYVFSLMCLFHQFVICDLFTLSLV